MNIDERVKCLFVLEEIIEVCKENRIVPSYKLAHIDKIIDEQIEIIIETDSSKLPGSYE